MSKWDDDLKAIGDALDAKDQRIAILVSNNKSLSLLGVKADMRIAELEKQVAEMEERIVKAGLPV